MHQNSLQGIACLCCSADALTNANGLLLLQQTFGMVEDYMALWTKPHALQPLSAQCEYLMITAYFANPVVQAVKRRKASK
eukprot:6487887-Amphidinium_carterae.1